MPASYLTEPEWTAAFAQFGLQETLAYANVTSSHFSLAKLYGGAKVDGHAFYYVDDTDELIRSDVVKWVERRRADACIARHQAEEAAARLAQGSIF